MAGCESGGCSGVCRGEVLASAGMARGLAASIPDIEIPASLVERVAADPVAAWVPRVRIARLRDSGASDGVHLGPVQRYREVPARLEALRGNTSHAGHRGRRPVPAPSYRFLAPAGPSFLLPR